MAEEKLFTINLRKEFIKAPSYRKSKKAITAVREFITHHLKTKEVKIGPQLNLKIWERGRKNPPAKIKVKSIIEDQIAYVELPGFKFAKPEIKTEEKKPETIMEKITGQKEGNKEKEQKELNKELEKEEEAKTKKEHKKEPANKPKKQTIEKSKISPKDQSQKIGRTGKKNSK